MLGVNHKWDACPRKGSTQAPVHPHIKLSKYWMQIILVMKTSLTIILMCPRERFPLYKSLSRLFLCYKKDWAMLLHLIYSCYSLLITLSQNYMLPIISVLAENTLLKTANHFLLLLVGFNTLTYRKNYDRSPTLVGHRAPSLVFSPART